MNNSRLAPKFPKQARGIGLIEVLIAMFVLAVGVLALGKLQSDYFGTSATSKARTEALAIAQGRIEDMRNYMHKAETLDEFNALYPVSTGANAATIDGVNARFSRKETIAANGDLRAVSVTVEWKDAAGEIQNIALDTELMFTPPKAPGVMAMVPEKVSVPSPTGRAKLGQGSVPDGAPTTPNNDGTKMYIADGDRNLVSGQKIVLTLEDACNTADGSCSDFVQIKGKVYIDRATQDSLAPRDIYVQASDAAYCTRYYVDALDNAQTIENADTIDLLTSRGDYVYFHYTCYLGGGWHGNIGLLLARGIKQSDKVCQGDPVTTNSSEAPVIAIRRAYRGMIYEKDSSGEPVTINGKIAYMSYGIADGAILPDPGTTDHSHDFVISSMSASSTQGINCIVQGVMVRADATSIDPGDLFEGNPDDFVCLNDGYLDSYDTDKYGHGPSCPYDPTDPPVARHVVSGSVEVVLSEASVFKDDILAAVTVNTSDGPDNCLLGDFATVGSSEQANYECDVYDWGSGWNGMIYTTAPGYELKLSCSPNPVELTAVTGDYVDNDIVCNFGNYALISGRVTTENVNRVLSSATISGGSCHVGSAGLSYECITNAYDVSWDGTVTFALSDGVTCPATGTTTDGTLVLEAGTATATGITGDNDLNITIQSSMDLCP